MIRSNLKRLAFQTGPRPLRCVIAGGGMSGLASAYRLREAGVGDIVILEKSGGGAGGVWRENRCCKTIFFIFQK